MKNNKGFAGVGVILTIIAILIVGGGAYYLGTRNVSTPNNIDLNNIKPINNNSNVIPPEVDSSFILIDTSLYSFKAPKDWKHSGLRDLMNNGCLWDSLSKGGDGLRMGGEIGIYPKSCFNLANAAGREEYTEKDGYYLIAFYNKESGTTTKEETETKLVYKKIVETFFVKDINKISFYTYKKHGFSIELPKDFIPREEQSEGGPAIMISLPTGGLAYVTDASFWEKYNIPNYTYVKDQKIGENTFKVYTYTGSNLYWFKKGNVGYEFSEQKFGTKTSTTELEKLLKTFKYTGWTSN